MKPPVILPLLRRYLPILGWGATYNRGALSSDAVAAVVVTIMLIPQSLAYALLAGLPAQMGLYASILPLVAYGIFGTSHALAVGPVAVISLMTAAAVGNLDIIDPVQYAAAAVVLAFISGLFLIALGVMRMGFLANFLSHPVIAGFITASAIIIATSQLKHIFGIRAQGHDLYHLVVSLSAHMGEVNWVTSGIGGAVMIFLVWVRKALKPLLLRAGTGPRLASLAAKSGPVVAVVVTTAVLAVLRLDQNGVAVVGHVPGGMPALAVPTFSLDLWGSLVGSALLISIIGFVESISVAHTLAARQRKRIDSNRELVALGVANVASALSSGFPVAGGFSRSVVNFDAGAETPAAGIFTALGILLAIMYLTPLLYFLPTATLAAIIIIAVLRLVDFSILKRTWVYSKTDFAAVSATIVVTLGLGVKLGISAGVLISILLYLYRTSRPHIAEVGRVPGTEHYRNVARHVVECDPRILTIRVDESLYFANARYLEDYIYDRVAANPKLRDLILMCTAVNDIDTSALESLEAVNERLKSAGVALSLSEVKGPVMDRLERTRFLRDLTGKVYLSQFQAAQNCRATMRAPHTKNNAACAQTGKPRGGSAPDC